MYGEDNYFIPELSEDERFRMSDCILAVAIGWGDYLNAAVIWYDTDTIEIVGVKDVWSDGHRMGVKTLDNCGHGRIISDEQAKAIIATANTSAYLAPRYMFMADFRTSFFAVADEYGKDMFMEFCSKDNDLSHFKCDKGWSFTELNGSWTQTVE